MKNVKEIFAYNLVKARKKIGYSQMKLAELTDLSPGMIAQEILSIVVDG
jgi:transcriptional regulator with XRE-family HTH domain